MRRSKLLKTVALTVIATLAGCTEGDDENRRTSANRDRAGASTLFVQTAEGGTLRRTSGGKYRLELTGVDRHAVFFSDRPQRDKGVVALADSLSVLYGPKSPPPNAALVVNERRLEGVVPLELARGRYDARRGLLVYDAKPLRDLTRPNLKHYDDRFDRTPPRRFGRASLFVDSVIGETCEGTLFNATPYRLSVSSFSKFGTDTWNIKPNTEFEIQPNGGGMPWRSDAPAFRGCGNDVKFDVLDENSETLATVETNLSKKFEPGFHGGYACKSSSPRFACNVINADTDPEGEFLKVTWNLGVR